jgi:hypothetical protein
VNNKRCGGRQLGGRAVLSPKAASFKELLMKAKIMELCRTCIHKKEGRFRVSYCGLSCRDCSEHPKDGVCVNYQKDKNVEHIKE